MSLVPFWSNKRRVLNNFQGDHSIRDEADYHHSSDYIVSNPMEWKDEESNEE